MPLQPVSLHANLLVNRGEGQPSRSLLSDENSRFLYHSKVVQIFSLRRKNKKATTTTTIPNMTTRNVEYPIFRVWACLTSSAPFATVAEASSSPPSSLPASFSSSRLPFPSFSPTVTSGGSSLFSLFSTCSMFPSPAGGGSESAPSSSGISCGRETQAPSVGESVPRVIRSILTAFFCWPTFLFYPSEAVRRKNNHGWVKRGKYLFCRFFSRDKMHLSPRLIQQQTFAVPLFKRHGATRITAASITTRRG